MSDDCPEGFMDSQEDKWMGTESSGVWENFAHNRQGSQDDIFRAYSEEKGNYLEKEIIQGATPGSWARGRP